MERWQGKIALVTGASSGIGAATVAELASAGMVVVGMARRQAKLQELSASLPATAEFYVQEGDVSKEEDVQRVFQFIRDNFGTIHLLVNNAGVVNLGRVLSTSPEVWKKTMDVNFMGVTMCCKEAITLMQESAVTDGHIININSIAGHGVPDRDDPIMNVYPASKNALTALSEILRFELVALGSSIKISNISPGYTDSELFHLENVAEDTVKMFQSRPRLLSKDVADAIIAVLATPPHVQITQLTIKPVGEPV